MTKFEQIGVGFQHDACNIQEARKAFKYSCDCCCHKGMQIDCDKCAIAATHSMVVACFNDQHKKGNQPRKGNGIMGRRQYTHNESHVLTLEDYIEEKLSMLECDFCIKITPSEIEHMRALKTEIAVDNYARKLWMSRL